MRKAIFADKYTFTKEPSSFDFPTKNLPTTGIDYSVSAHIPIDEDMIFKARQMEAEVLKNLKDRPNYTGFESEGRYYVGFLGELIFEKYLRDNKKQFVFEIIADGNSQGSDFIVEAHRALKIEIKSSDHPYAKNLLVPKAQYDWRESDLYVAIQIGGVFGQVVGYCMRHELILDTTGWKTPTYKMLYKNLKSTKPLLDKLK